MRVLLFSLLLFLAPADDPTEAGRRGNAHFENGRFAEAAEAYRAGLAAAAPDDLEARYGLLHNLGAALHRLEDYDGAQQAFDAAVDLAATPDALARAAYNAGNNAYRRDDLQGAVDHYKQALLADPANENARFNYEVAKRRLDEQQQQEQQQGGEQGEQNPQDQQQDGQNQQDGEQDSEQDQQQDQQQDEQQEGQDGEQNQNEQGDEQQQPPQQQPPPNPNELSRQQAEQILEALENEEEQLLRQVQKLKGRPRQVEKDW